MHDFIGIISIYPKLEIVLPDDDIATILESLVKISAISDRDSEQGGTRNANLLNCLTKLAGIVSYLKIYSIRSSIRGSHGFETEALFLLPERWGFVFCISPRQIGLFSLDTVPPKSRTKPLMQAQRTLSIYSRTFPMKQIRPYNRA